MKNLARANKLLREIAKKDKKITPVTPKDEELFLKFFKTEPHTYGNSWIYVTQGMFGIGPYGLGYKYYDGKNLSAVAIYPKIEQQDLHCFYWVRPMGPEILEVIDVLAKTILKHYSIPTYVKKIFKDQAINLKKRGFKNTSGFPWHSSCASEDDTFPEQIFEVKKTIELSQTLPRKKHLKKSVIRVNQLKSNHNIKVHDLDQEEAWKLTKEFFHSNIINEKKINISDEFDYKNMILNNNFKNVIKKMVIVDDIPLGYYIMEKQNNLYSSLYGLIVLRNKLKYLVDYMLLYVFNNTQTPFLNIGGSEDEGLDKFKKKYYPTSEQKMYWVTLFR